MISSAVFRSRLTQFLIFGGAIFALAPKPPSLSDVSLSSADLEAMNQAEAKKLGRGEVDGDLLAAVKLRAIEDEVLYREALRLGLDQDDRLVRQRLIQKVLFLARDLSGTTKPATEAELRAEYEAAPERWREPPRARFQHVYCAERCEQLEAKVRAHDSPELPALGDAFPIARDVKAAKPELVESFGPEFTQKIFAAGGGALGEWAGPWPSNYGYHFVRVLEVAEARVPPFEEVRGKVQLALLISKKDRAVREYLHQAYARYDITLDGEPFAPESLEVRNPLARANVAKEGED